MTSLAINEADEQRLRDLAQGIAKDIEETPDLLARLGFTVEDYEELATTRVFKTMLDEALSEWLGANNTHKRVKLKAATNVEMSLPSFYVAMTNPTETLSARVKALEIMARIGGLGNPEPVLAGSGNAFNLTIQLNETKSISVDMGGGSVLVEESAVVTQSELPYSQSALLNDVVFEEL